MTTATAKHQMISQLSAHWFKSAEKDNVFSGDDVIDAYLKGRSDGLNSEDSLLFKALETNIEKSFPIQKK